MGEGAKDAAPMAGKLDGGVESSVPQSVSFKEESNLIADLAEPEKKALEDLKELIIVAITNDELIPSPPPAEAPRSAAPPPNEEAAPPPEEEPLICEDDGSKTVEAIEETIVPAVSLEETLISAESTEPIPVAPVGEISIWGVPLVGDEKSDTVLLKFLRARDFKVGDAFAMIKDVLMWRKQIGVDGFLDETLDVPPELEKVVFMHGHDKEGHPVCYNIYGEFHDNDLYAKAFGGDERRQNFLKWRIQFLERGIRKELDFSPGGISTMVQVIDLKNVRGPGKWELRVATKQALALLQDNYPEFVAKQLFINVPWWYLAYNLMISSIFTQRSKSKFVFTGSSKSTETLFKYIAPEQIPVQYGGLTKDKDPNFTIDDIATEVAIKPLSKHSIQISVSGGCVLVWELRVLGWEVSYGAEFVPSADNGYTVIVTKARKFVMADEPVVKNSFKASESGTVVLKVDNPTFKKKKLLFRSKVKGCTESM